MIRCTQRMVGNRMTADITLSSGVIGRVIEHADWDIQFNQTFDGYIPVVLLPGKKPIIYHWTRFPNTHEGFIACAKAALVRAVEWSKNDPSLF